MERLTTLRSRARYSQYSEPRYQTPIALTTSFVRAWYDTQVESALDYIRTQQTETCFEASSPVHIRQHGILHICIRTNDSLAKEQDSTRKGTLHVCHCRFVDLPKCFGEQLSVGNSDTGTGLIR